MLREDNIHKMLEFTYQRFEIYNPRVETDWTLFEYEVMRILRTGDPTVHIDFDRSYPFTVSNCQRHLYPLGLSDMRSVVYLDEPHMACGYCGLIVTMPGGRDYRERRGGFRQGGYAG